MRFLDNTKMGPKLIGAFMLVAALLVGMGLLGSNKIQSIEAADADLYLKMTVPLGEMGDIRQAFQRQRVNLRDAIMTGDSEKFGGRIKELEAELTALEESFQKTLLTDEGKAAFKTYKDANSKYDQASIKILALAQAGKSKEAEAILRGDGAKATAEVNSALDTLQKMKLSLAKKTAESNTIMADGASRLMYIIMGIAVVFSVGIGWILTKSITGPWARAWR